MTDSSKPLLGFGHVTISRRFKQNQRQFPRPSKPDAKRQGERLIPQFQTLATAFSEKRASLQTKLPDEVDPALVVVFDLAGSITDFCNAINKIDGMEFLSELIAEQSEPDDDFHMIDPKIGRTGKPVHHSLYLVMSNARAIDELLKLFNTWQSNQEIKFEHGLSKFKDAFKQLVNIRRWDTQDRIRETGLLEQWQEHLEIVGQSVSPVFVEIELWFRNNPEHRRQAETTVSDIIIATHGKVIHTSVIPEIGYHALLAEIPIQQVKDVLNNGAEKIQLLTTDEIMFVSPFTPMSTTPYKTEPTAKTDFSKFKELQTEPRIALLDGMPFQNHDALRGRLIIDDPEGTGDDYPVLSRQHGTAMASLIIHGDLSSPRPPLDRPLYVRPIMKPQPVTGRESTIPDQLFTDVLHKAIKRIIEGDSNKEAVAPSVRIVNLSIGAAPRALTRRISPVGRLLDWFANHYNLLFIVSAGNHTSDINIPASEASDSKTAIKAARRAAYDQSLVKGIFPPGDAINALTVGSTHSDAAGDVDTPDTVWDITPSRTPSYYSATGPGVGRSIKPDLFHVGGRALYVRPVISDDSARATLKLAETSARGPGIQVAAPNRDASTNSTIFTIGTSNAAALVSHEASRLFDILETTTVYESDPPFPDPQFHPLLVRALLVHSSSWNGWDNGLRNDLDISGQNARSKLTALLGYGGIDLERLGTAASNRAVLLAGEFISRDQCHTYELPLPPSLRSKAEWHKFTITLAYATPTVGNLNRYRGAKVYFRKPDEKLTGCERVEADHNAVRRGSIQHEIIEGSRAMTFVDGETLPIHIECMKDAKQLGKDHKIRYGLVVSIETAEQTSTTIHEEVRTRLRQRSRQQIK